MKNLLIGILALGSISAFAQVVKVESGIQVHNNIKKVYQKKIISEGFPALVSANGSTVAPAIPALYKRVYVGFRSESENVTSPTALELDCEKNLKNNFNIARKELGFKSNNDLSKLGLSNIVLTVISDMDQAIDKDVFSSIIDTSGIKGRKMVEFAILFGTVCIPQSVQIIKEEIKTRM